MIFCLPETRVSLMFQVVGGSKKLTVSRWLHRRLNVANALDRDAVLIVAIHELVFELANLVDEHAELVRDIRDIVVACLAPER